MKSVLGMPSEARLHGSHVSVGPREVGGPNAPPLAHITASDPPFHLSQSVPRRKRQEVLKPSRSPC